MSNFLLYAETRILAKHNIKNGNIFLYFEKKTQLVGCYGNKKRQDKYPGDVAQVSGFLRYETRTCGIPILKRQTCPDNSVENSRQKANNGRKLNYEKQNYYF